MEHTVQSLRLLGATADAHESSLMVQRSAKAMAEMRKIGKEDRKNLAYANLAFYNDTS